MEKEGLNSIQYSIVKIKFKKLFTHIFVSYDENEITKNYIEKTTATKSSITISNVNSTNTKNLSLLKQSNFSTISKH